MKRIALLMLESWFLPAAVACDHREQKKPDYAVDQKTPTGSVDPASELHKK